MPPSEKNTKQKKWNDMYKQLVSYKDKHGGDFLVPQSYKEEEEEDDDDDEKKVGTKLGKWVTQQRKAFKNNNLSKDRVDNKLTSIDGFVFNNNNVLVKEEINEARWDDMFNRLELYKQKHGDCLVPKRYKEDTKLGIWVMRQRQCYKNNKLSIVRVDKLKSIGFVFSIRKKKNDVTRWDDMYSRLVSYKKKYGNCSVTRSYKGEDKQLGSWVNNQRHKYKSNILSNDRIDKLRTIGFGFVFDDDMKWYSMYNRLVSYKEKYGNCLVPQSYKEEDTNKLDLVKWVMAQRISYKNNKLSNNRIDKLQEIGFVFSSKQGKCKLVETNFLRSKSNLKEKQKYISRTNNTNKVNNDIDIQSSATITATTTTEKSQQNTNCCCNSNISIHSDKHDNVIKKDVFAGSASRTTTKPCSQEDHASSLATLGSNARCCSKKSKKDMPLAPVRKKKATTIIMTTPNNPHNDKYDNLNSIGLFARRGSSVEKLKKKRGEKSWNDMYNKLISYKEKYGNCLVPQGYKQDRKLGRWVDNQRQSNKNNKLSNDRIDKLKSIDFIFCLQQERDDTWNSVWNDMFHRLELYKEKYGNCFVPRKYKDNDDKQLGIWCNNQKRNYNHDKLSDERVSKLKEIGFVFINIKTEDNETRWDNMFHRLVSYKEKYGNCLLPRGYKQDRKLGRWVSTQRISYKNNKLSNNRIDKLQAIGFVFSSKQAKAKCKLIETTLRSKSNLKEQQEHISRTNNTNNVNNDIDIQSSSTSTTTKSQHNINCCCNSNISIHSDKHDDVIKKDNVAGSARTTTKPCSQEDHASSSSKTYNKQEEEEVKKNEFFCTGNDSSSKNIEAEPEDIVSCSIVTKSGAATNSFQNNDRDNLFQEVNWC